jgi:hypothetical protein
MTLPFSFSNVQSIARDAATCPNIGKTHDLLPLPPNKGAHSRHRKKNNAKNADAT